MLLEMRVSLRRPGMYMYICSCFYFQNRVFVCMYVCMYVCRNTVMFISMSIVGVCMPV